MGCHIRDCSVVFVDPKPQFLERLDKAFKGLSKEMQLFRDYRPEENGVYLIRGVGTFTRPGEFEAYLDTVKRDVHDYELRRFVHDLPSVLKELCSEAFDEHFDLTLRDDVEDLREG